MRPHTQPHTPPGGRSPLQTQQLAGKLLRIMPREPACTPTQSVWGFLFFLMLLFVIIQNYKYNRERVYIHAPLE